MRAQQERAPPPNSVLSNFSPAWSGSNLNGVSVSASDIFIETSIWKVLFTIDKY
jgi:hypothetical protein